MSMQLHVLASGSSGNASVLEIDGFGVLIDFGLPTRVLTERMQRCELSWQRIHAVVLSHSHSDHWQAATLTQLAKRHLPIYCHAEHTKFMNRDSRAYTALMEAGLLRFYEPGQQWSLRADCHCLPVALQHDAAMTCGFRFEGTGSIFGVPWALGYAADLGSWTPALARQFADVEILALEFNHDVALQLRSGRHPYLIRRVLGDKGHLSNEQAAAMLSEILKLSQPGRLQSLVQLHLSRECNRPELARATAQNVLDRFGIDVAIHTADQDQTGLTIPLGKPLAGLPRRRRLLVKSPDVIQPLLPFPVDDNPGEEISA